MTTAKKSPVKKISGSSKGRESKVAKQSTASGAPRAGAVAKGVAKKPTSKRLPKSGSKSTSMPKKGQDPKGGLTAAGRKFFAEKDGSKLRPGVRGAADTPEKMMRKGSFLRRHFANPPGPVTDEKGEPTRQALQAAAWGEPVPKNEADEKRLADKGSELLNRYHQAKGDKPRTAPKKRATKRASR